MAQPPLEHQIEHLDRIVVCRTAAEGIYHVEGTLKGSGRPRKLQPEIESFKLLGYVPVLEEQVVLFASASGQVVELLPVKDGWVDYAPADASVRRRMALHELKALVRGPDSHQPGGREKSKTAFGVLTFFAAAMVFVALLQLHASREAMNLLATGTRVTGRCEALSPEGPKVSPRFSYRFEVSGNSYEAHDRPVHKEAWDQLRVGQPIEISYDPSQPSRNVSEPERSMFKATPWGAFLLFGFAAAFFAGGLFLLLVGGYPEASHR